MKAKRLISIVLVICFLFSSSFAEEANKSFIEQLGDWISGEWSGFTIWLRTITWDNPYSWIRDMVLEEGILAYDSFIEIRSFISENPDSVAIKNKCYPDETDKLKEVIV